MGQGQELGYGLRDLEVGYMGKDEKNAQILANSNSRRIVGQLCTE